MFKKGKLEKKICQTRFKFVGDFKTGPKKAHYAARRAVLYIQHKYVHVS